MKKESRWEMFQYYFLELTITLVMLVGAIVFGIFSGMITISKYAIAGHLLFGLLGQ